MRVLTIDGKDYMLPNALNPFQKEMYIHLINWKWKHITEDPGTDRGNKYDAILPDSYADKLSMLYPEITAALERHLKKFPFRRHIYFNHMASSQAANINLFLPILTHKNADAILSALKPDFASLAMSELDLGFRIEFWDEPFGNLGDKTKVSGTDSDIAIAYHNHQGELCLWLIEHKLTEREFTECGGSRSKAKKDKHDCTKSFAAILNDKHSCYYHDVCKFNYWDITEANRAFFANHAEFDSCPFRMGMNQLWRNQLLALSIEKDDQQPYKHVTFSVVKHPRNWHLDKTLEVYKNLIGCNPKFTIFTSAKVVDTANSKGDAELAKWVKWYKDLYML